MAIRKFSKEHIKNLSLSHKGKHYSPETEFKKGHKAPITAFKKGNIPWNKGMKSTNYCEICGIPLVSIYAKRCKTHSHIETRHWNWKGGVTSRNDKIRHSSKFKNWGKEVFKRDNFTCQYCGKKGCYLHSHHIIPFSECLNLEWKEEIFDVDNGLTLCKDCHLEEHFGDRNGKI